jgi:hypothetical protein
MAGVLHINWYGTVFRKNLLADAVVELAPISLRYGATKYQVHLSLDDRYKVIQMMWFESKDDWYRFWEGPEALEFRRRYTGKYQIPIVYTWHDELASGEVGPAVAHDGDIPAPAPEPTPTAA